MTLRSSTMRLFTDGSVNPKSNIGYGAYLMVDENKLASDIELKDVRTKRFKNTTSTKLELETLLWAFDEIDLKNCKIIIYTDCQNIIGLQKRREKLERANYVSKTNKLIKNHELYKEFYKNVDLTQVEFVKVEGHKKKNDKNDIDDIFTLVDKASRSALRNSLEVI